MGINMKNILFIVCSVILSTVNVIVLFADKLEWVIPENIRLEIVGSAKVEYYFKKGVRVGIKC